MKEMKYLTGYPEQIKAQVQQLLHADRLGAVLLQKYATTHAVRTDKALYLYVLELKNQFLRQAEPIGKIAYDNKIRVIQQALGQHTFISRVQGGKLKAKHEIRIASMFKNAPIEFLKMIVVHELAHLKEKEHNKAFYKLCQFMEPNYHQYELDVRLYLIQLELHGEGLWGKKTPNIAPI